jgi:hypothetical protein
MSVFAIFFFYNHMTSTLWRYWISSEVQSSTSLTGAKHGQEIYKPAVNGLSKITQLDFVQLNIIYFRSPSNLFLQANTYHVEVRTQGQGCNDWP